MREVRAQQFSHYAAVDPVWAMDGERVEQEREVQHFTRPLWMLMAGAQAAKKLSLSIHWGFGGSMLTLLRDIIGNL